MTRVHHSRPSRLQLSGEPSGGARLRPAPPRVAPAMGPDAALRRAGRLGHNLVQGKLVSTPPAPQPVVQRLYPYQQLPTLRERAGARFYHDQSQGEMDRLVYRYDALQNTSGTVLTDRFADAGTPALEQAEITKIIRGAINSTKTVEQARTKALKKVASPSYVWSNALYTNLVVDQFFSESIKFTDNADNTDETRKTELIAHLKGEAQTQADEFLKSREDIEIREISVPEKSKRPFAKALKKMPFVKSLYEGKIHKQLARSDEEYEKVKGPAKWKDGGSLADPDNRELINDGYFFQFTQRSDIDNGALEARLKQADRFIKKLVEPQLLGEMKKPKVKVHLLNMQSPTNPLGFRAYQSSGELHLAQDEPMKVIVHETGHYIEDNLPHTAWHDIQLLLYGRHAAKAKSDQRAGFGPFPILKEGRFVGDYPVTGSYTSKVYEGSGSTEVVSMTTEYLANPNKLKSLIDDDPQQAAIVLRALRPKEYKSTKDLERYAKYLPN